MKQVALFQEKTMNKFKDREVNVEFCCVMTRNKLLKSTTTVENYKHFSCVFSQEQ